jgi:septal ring factor EnvC (AmiA/AmiB activator)
MSSVYIISSIVILLAILACYAFVSQTLALRKQHRDKLQTVLTAKVRNFKHMLSGFPAGFLPKDLTVLVLRSLIDMYEQLVDIDPDNNQFKQDLQSVSQQLNEVQRQTKPVAPAAIDNPQQLKDAKTCLDELHKFVFQLEGKGALNRTQADNYRNLIKQLVLQVTVDAYLFSGRHARQASKTRLAIHYYTLAHKLLSKENKGGAQDKKLAAINQVLNELQEKLKEEVPHASAPVKPAEDTEGDWNKLKPDDSWKKKQVYD